MRKEFRFLDFVQRWAIAPRLHHQTVASHSFFVTLYCSQICEMLRVPLDQRAIVLDVALRHDAHEVWESDIPGPAKRAITDETRHRDYKGKFFQQMDELYQMRSNMAQDKSVNLWNDAAPVMVSPAQIVKVADLIDEVFYLAMEMNLGNNMVRGLYQKSLSRLDQAALNLAGDEFAETLMQEVGRQVARLGEEGAIIPDNDDDITPVVDVEDDPS